MGVVGAEFGPVIFPAADRKESDMAWEDLEGKNRQPICNS